MVEVLGGQCIAMRVMETSLPVWVQEECLRESNAESRLIGSPVQNGNPTSHFSPYSKDEKRERDNAF